MDTAFTRINVFRADYSWLMRKFGNDEPRPAQGVLVARAREYIEELEGEIKLCYEEDPK